MFRSILCPVDFSVHSRRALRYAAALADRFGARLTVVSVSDPLLVAAARAAARGAPPLPDQSRAELSRFVQNSLRTGQLNADRVALVVAIGEPSAEIGRAARRLRSNLIVMGTEGLSGVPRFFFGSTTAAVLRRARVPVLTVPGRSGRRTATGGVTVTELLVPVDLEKGWQSDAVRAAAVARAFEVPMRLVHVVRPLQVPAWLRIGGHTDRERVAKAQAALERIATRLTTSGRIACLVAVGNPAHEIARLSRRGRPLVVMSLQRGDGLWQQRGSIAYQILTESSAPVLALTK